MKRKSILNILGTGLLLVGVLSMTGCDLSGDTSSTPQKDISNPQENENTYPSETPAVETDKDEKPLGEEKDDETSSSTPTTEVKDDSETVIPEEDKGILDIEREKELSFRKEGNDREAEELLISLQQKDGKNDSIILATTPSKEEDKSSTKNTWERSIDLLKSATFPNQEEIKRLEERASGPYLIDYELENVKKEAMIPLSFLDIPKKGEEGYVPTYYNSFFREDIETAIIEGVNNLRESKGLNALKENKTALKMVRYTSNAQMQTANDYMLSAPKSSIPKKETIYKICNMPKFFQGTTISAQTYTFSNFLSSEDIIREIVSNENYVKELSFEKDVDISVGVAVFEEFEKDDDYRAIRAYRYYVVNIFVGNLNPTVNGTEINNIP